MIKQHEGKIINISSNSSNIAPPYWSAYCVSKAALNMLTRCLAMELAPYKINVNAIAPGDILTELSRHVLEDSEMGKTMLSYIPVGRWGETREVALLAVYLASKASDFITGETLVMDGGQLARGAGV
jgi:NAD(P)-dependent dehydrogenase (short-subunit alcohol dehydrogenase family)